MKVGNRPKVIFNELDLEVLLYLEQYVSKIGDISKVLKINQKSMKPHIDKLLINKFLKWEFDCLTTSQKGRKLIKFLEIEHPKGIDFRRKHESYSKTPSKTKQIIKEKS